MLIPRKLTWLLTRSRNDSIITTYTQQLGATKKALQNFVAQNNNWNSFFKGTQYSLNTAKDRQALADMIDSALSPENLTCYG